MKKSCLTCNNENCYIACGIPQYLKKDCVKHHETWDIDNDFECENHNKYKKQKENKMMTNIEEYLIQNFKFENAKIFDIQLSLGSVSFCVKGRCSELDERLTKENPTDDFIKELKKLEEDCEPSLFNPIDFV